MLSGWPLAKSGIFTNFELNGADPIPLGGARESSRRSNWLHLHLRSSPDANLCNYCVFRKLLDLAYWRWSTIGVAHPHMASS